MHTCDMARARRHQRLTATFAFGLLALVAELAGRSLTHRLDVGRHVHAGGAYRHAEYYPALLLVIKVAAALLLSQLAWRLVKARRGLASAGLRVPWPRLELSPRLWLGAFLLTSLCYLLQTDAERISSGRWPLLAPWLHTSALPVFAVLAVAVAVVYSLVIRWLHELERTVAELSALKPRPAEPDPPRRARASAANPRRLFGLAFESRPPPLTA
jgi:hypothetical protein